MSYVVVTVRHGDVEHKVARVRLVMATARPEKQDIGCSTFFVKWS